MDEINEAAAKLRMIVRLLNRRAQAGTGEGSPTRSEQAVLAWLDERGSLTLTALAATEHVRLQSMGQTVDALELQGRVARSAHPSDRRQVLISLTRDGRNALKKGRELRQAWLVEAMRTLLNAKERRILIASIDLLDRIVRVKAGDREGLAKI
ncbi:MAG: MarR family winged helix-turn-helix transcriptional regulator [Bryobacteraceae bacterium]